MQTGIADENIISGIALFLGQAPFQSKCSLQKGNFSFVFRATSLSAVS